ncbi:MAG: TetR/AcrR family transcriptional regulator [Lachnospiraceae bacterium]|jgi:AcrR family transcriptional regulator|nr:TetR/AcrR family transcriptional regulator [Lachnospiraceae bacterium]
MAAERKRLPEGIRREEILDACDRLYEKQGFREISMKSISSETSFSRPSIYNYFETKEEIFLGLLTREYELWMSDLEDAAGSGKVFTKAQLAEKIALSLQKRKTLLKIMAMDLYEIEDNSRLERLVAFKTVFAGSQSAFESLLRKAIPDLTEERADEIRYAFFPFMNGIYPYAYPTKKQCEAMDEAGVVYHRLTIREITAGFLKQVL